MRELIARGETKEAVDRAKVLHREFATAAAGALLVEAYAARVATLRERGLALEAQALVDLVSKRFPQSSALLKAPPDAGVKLDESLDELLRPLNEPELAPDQQAAIVQALRRELADPGALARCAALPAEHPLKKAAAAVAQALDAVTRGPVGDEEIALAEISHRSPLAPWKLLVRAIAFFYRRDDDSCMQCLEAIDPESPPARLVPAIRAALRGVADKTLTPAAASLASRIVSHRAAFHDALKALDSAFNAGNQGKIFEATRRAIEHCEREAPELLDHLRQRISIRAGMLDLTPHKIKKAMGASSLKDARFWRLHALAAEIGGNPIQACTMWEEFRKHAVHQGWCRPDGIEVAMLYRHTAAVLRRIPKAFVERERASLPSLLRVCRASYADQPPEIRAVGLHDASAAVDPYFLHAEMLYERACAIDPDPESFREWLDHVRGRNGFGKAANDVAETWHSALPADTRPLLFLMESAEARRAYKKALGYLEEAERSDALDPAVRRARLRLLVASALRHLTGKQARLLDKDVAALEALPSIQEKRRPAFVASLRWASATLEGDGAGADRWREEACRRLESRSAGFVLLSTIGAAIGAAPPEEAAEEGEALARAVAQACALGEDLGVRVAIPRKWAPSLIRALGKCGGAIDSFGLRAIAQAALDARHAKLAYAASGAGLAQGGPLSARFLLLRARSLPEAASERRLLCLRAAAQRARQQRDEAVIAEAVDLLNDEDDAPSWLHECEAQALSMGVEELNRVVEHEKQARDYPKPDEFDDDDDGDAGGERCDCPACRRSRGEDAMPGGLPPLPPGLPEELAKELLKLMEKHGRPDGPIPDPRLLERLDPELMGEIEQMLFQFDDPPFDPPRRRRRRRT